MLTVSYNNVSVLEAIYLLSNNDGYFDADLKSVVII